MSTRKSNWEQLGAEHDARFAAELAAKQPVDWSDPEVTGGLSATEIAAYRADDEAENVPVVIVVRDPDCSNEYRVFNGAAETYDIDLGYHDLSDLNEWTDWATSHISSAQDFRLRGLVDVAEYIENAVNEARERYQ